MRRVIRKKNDGNLSCFQKNTLYAVYKSYGTFTYTVKCDIISKYCIYNILIICYGIVFYLLLSTVFVCNTVFRYFRIHYRNVTS